MGHSPARRMFISPALMQIAKHAVRRRPSVIARAGSDLPHNPVGPLDATVGTSSGTSLPASLACQGALRVPGVPSLT
jgi:hypothetical protein